MLYPKSEIKRHLSELGIKYNDIVLIHGNAGVASQYIYQSEQNPIDSFFRELKSYIYDGTIIVPTFTYSATKGKIFDSEKTPSSVGLFSESFRLIDGVKRSQHPILSISSLGKHANYFTDARIDDCFGEDTFFDQMYINNVKIVTLGCEFERVTFIHYVEQKLKVSYRYIKQFNAEIKNMGITKKLDVSYFVRDLNLNTNLNFESLESEALRQRKICIEPFGRYKARCISSIDFFQIASKLIKDDEYALIKEQSKL